MHFPFNGWRSQSGFSCHCEALNVTKGGKGAEGEKDKCEAVLVGAGVPQTELQYTVSALPAASY